MPHVTVQGKRMYYESYGEGEPLVVLNGIMMSTGSWGAFVPAFSRSFRLILVDFIDQGKSDKADAEYDLWYHVSTLADLLTAIGCEKVHLLGASYGAQVALLFAGKYPGRLRSLILSGVPAYTSNILREIGDSWDLAAATNDVPTFFRATMPFIYSQAFFESRGEWLRQREKLFIQILTPEWFGSFRRLLHSARSYDARPGLGQITAPTLLISAELDTITPVQCQEQLAAAIPGSHWAVIKGAGHAAMYERPREFASLVVGFVATCADEFAIK